MQGYLHQSKASQLLLVVLQIEVIQIPVYMSQK